jgi:hypothetical protein
MEHGTMVQRLGRVVGALVIAAGLLMSVSAVRTFALNIDIGDLPAGTTCERVSVNFRECTTPDGTKYWCTDNGTCDKAPMIVHTVRGIQVAGGLSIDPGDYSNPSPRFPLPQATVAGFALP